MADMVQTRNLIKPNGVQEELFSEISEMRQQNLTLQNNSEISRLAQGLTNCFVQLVEQWHRITKNQIKNMSPEHKEALVSLVYERAYKRGCRLRITLLCIPVIGWAILDEAIPLTIEFRNSVHSLRKILGDSFDPIKTILERLQ